jgi:hypothetical protein
MPIKIETLYVNIDFNIPGSASTYLTRNLFYFPSVQKKMGGSLKFGGALSRYQYFTFDTKYPVDELKKLSRERQVSFFFDKKLFLDVLSGREVTTSPLQRFENGNYNVMCMLGCMFPTSFPVSNNSQSSFEVKIEQKVNTSDEFDFSNEGTVFSYIQSGGSAYTITKSIWINDIINNKTFRRLVDDINKYNDWEMKQKNDLLKDIELQKKEFTDLKNRFVAEYTSSDKTLQDLSTLANRPLESYGYGYRSSDAIKNIKIKAILPGLQREVENFFSNQNDIEKLVSISINIKDLIEKLGSTSDALPRDLLKIIKYAKLIYSDKVIIYVIEHPEYIKKVNKEMREKLSKYKNISQIVSILQEFSSPKLNSSNVELQKLIDDFIKTKDSVLKNIKGLAAYVRSVYLLKSKNLTGPYSIDLLNVGISLSKLPFLKNGKLIKLQERRLEIQIQLDAFKGIITSDNVKCIHRNAVLEKLYESLTLNGVSIETVELDKVRPYLDFGAIKKQGGKSRKQKKMKGNVTRKHRRVLKNMDN